MLASTASSVVPSPKAPAFAHAFDVRVDDVIFPGENHVLRIEGIAIRPFCALDQVHGQLLAVVSPFPRLGELRQRLDFLRCQHPHRAGAHEAHHCRMLGAAITLVAPGNPVPALRTPADHVAKRAAVDARTVGRHRGVDDKRLLGQALFNRRQFAGLHELGDPFRLVIGGKRSVAEERVVRHQDRLGGRYLLRHWVGDRAFKVVRPERRMWRCLSRERPQRMRRNLSSMSFPPVSSSGDRTSPLSCRRGSVPRRRCGNRPPHHDRVVDFFVRPTARRATSPPANVRLCCLRSVGRG